MALTPCFYCCLFVFCAHAEVSHSSPLRVPLPFLGRHKAQGGHTTHFNTHLAVFLLLPHLGNGFLLLLPIITALTFMSLTECHFARYWIRSNQQQSILNGQRLASCHRTSPCRREPSLPFRGALQGCVYVPVAAACRLWWAEPHAKMQQQSWMPSRLEVCTSWVEVTSLMGHGKSNSVVPEVNSSPFRKDQSWEPQRMVLISGSSIWLCI